ncbi:MAG: DNA polymerase III subunit gamma/tau [Prevotellaceae bacterium]|jgi:DNA polymerase-3 subunit gamma/tau|nr:DNA polymerase III subunit gamma/tau [Prevotellaceae bacterium]
MEHFVVSARKYRPQRFDTVLGQNNIAATLKNSILRKQLAHAYLFCGPRGVGKTTCARIFAKTINCLSPTSDMEACGQCESCLSFTEGRSYSIHELDAASNNSVEDIRQIIEKVRIPPQIGAYSVYIIDEVHMLSQSAFNAFLKTLEEPPSYALFILATTEKHKILPTILSRCQTYDFNRIGVAEMANALTLIAQQEGVQIEPEALHVLANKADGSMRDALTLYDQTVAFCGANITYQQVISNLNVLDYDYYFTLTDSFLAHDYINALTVFDEILFKGFNALYFVAGLSSHFRDLLVSKNSATLPLLEMSPALASKYGEQAAQCSFAFLYESLRICAACESGYKSSGNARLHIELTLIRLSHIGFGEQAAATPPPKTTVDTPAPPPTTTIPATLPPASTFSINAMLKKEQQKSLEQAVAPVQSTRNMPFTQEQLNGAWARMSDAYKTLPRLYTSLLAGAPRIENNTAIFFEVESATQKEWMEQKCVGAMCTSLKNELNNDFLTLTLEVKPAEPNDKSRLYMPEDKANFLFETHPQVRELKNDLQLEIT